MLYGHLETAYHRYRPPDPSAGSARRDRRLSDVVPLAFHPDNTGLSHLPKPSALTDLRTIAVSRLMLDQHPAHQGLLDHARPGHIPGGHWPTARMTSTAPYDMN